MTLLVLTQYASHPVSKEGTTGAAPLGIAHAGVVARRAAARIVQTRHLVRPGNRDVWKYAGDRIRRRGADIGRETRATASAFGEKGFQGRSAQRCTIIGHEVTAIEVSTRESGTGRGERATFFARDYARDLRGMLWGTNDSIRARRQGNGKMCPSGGLSDRNRTCISRLGGTCSIH